MEPIQFDRLILHPGSPKTGTSGLQNFLDRKRAVLFTQGYLYPKAAIPTETDTARGHHAIAQHHNPASSVPNPMLRAIIEALREEIAAAPGHTVILSSEEFFGASRIELLKQFLRPRHCHVYVCLRHDDKEKC